MSALAWVLLAALSGPEVERGTIGTDIEFERHVQEMTGGRERLPRVPFEGSDYQGRLWRDVRQGHAVYHWPERRLYLIHDFFCTSDSTGATMPEAMNSELRRTVTLQPAPVRCWISTKKIAPKAIVKTVTKPIRYE